MCTLLKVRHIYMHFEPQLLRSTEDDVRIQKKALKYEWNNGGVERRRGESEALAPLCASKGKL